MAGAVEYLLTAIVVMSTYIGYAALRFVINPVGFNWPDVSWFILVIMGGVFLVLYLTLFWSTTGKPLGGSIMGTRVVSSAGTRLGFVHAFARACAVVILPIGLFWSAVSPSCRSLQDIVVRTAVLYDYDITTTHRISG